jgi:hypothetical protein
MNIDTKIAIISALAAVISAFSAYRSNRIAKIALNLSTKQYSDSQPYFSLYYNEGVRYIVHKEKVSKSLLLFHITIRNKSSFRNSFKAGLEIEFLRNDDTFAKVLTEHNPKLLELFKSSDLTVFPLDIELEAKSISTKWLIFEQPELLGKTHRIEKYEITLADMNENKSIIEAVLIKNITI